MRAFKVIAAIAVGVYVALVLAYFSNQGSIIFQPLEGYASPADVGLASAIEVQIAGDGDESLTAWWIAPQRAKPVVIYFHGSGGAVYSAHVIYSELAAEGFGVLGVGYPGYPGSTGDPSQSALVAAAQAHYDFLLDQNVPPESIVFYGSSLGSGVAAQLTKSRTPAVLIMEAPFASMLDLVKSRTRLLPVSLMLRHKFQSDQALRGQDTPLIWIHGTSDQLIPLSMGQTLFDGYDGPKTAHVIPDGGHNNLWFVGGREIILDALSKLPPPPG